MQVQVAAINFGEYMSKQQVFLRKMADIRREFLENKKKMTILERNSDYEKCEEHNRILEREYEEESGKHEDAKQDEANNLEESKYDLECAYITFKDTQTVKQLKKAFDVGYCDRRCTMFCGCFCPKRYKTMEKKHILFKRWPSIKVACEPENIKWENFRFSKSNRKKL